MLKHSRKFKLVPVDESGENDFSQPVEPPTAPIVTKLNMLDRELRNILEDSTLREKEKMEQYENILMKWGKFYRQYQSTDSGGRENNTLTNSINSSNIYHSTPNTAVRHHDNTTFTPIRYRSQSPTDRDVTTSRRQQVGTPRSTAPTGATAARADKPNGSPRSRSPRVSGSSSSVTSDSFVTPPSSTYRKKSNKKDRKLTPKQALRASRRLLERNGYLPKQIGSSWLSWHPRSNGQRKRH